MGTNRKQMRHQKYIDPYCIHLIMHLWMVCVMGVKKLHIQVHNNYIEVGKGDYNYFGVNYFWAQHSSSIKFQHF